MKLLPAFVILCLMSGCTTSKPVTTVMNPEEEMYFSVEPNSKTRIITYHVEIKKFSPGLQSEFEQAMAHLSGKCWFWAVSDYCVKFVNFTNSSPLKLYKREQSDIKMLLTAMDQEDKIQAQNFKWDGQKLRRTSNSDLKLSSEGNQQDRLVKFMVLWALK